MISPSKAPMRVTYFSGRQTRGKTTVLRHRRNKCDEEGQPFDIINTETHKPGIRKFVGSRVHTLPLTATNPAAMHEYIFNKTKEVQAKGARHLIIDTNGEDERVLDMAREYPLYEIYAEMGCQAQLFFIAGADVEDLRYLETIDKTRAFWGATTIIGFAQHSCQGTDPLKLYDAFASNKLIKEIIGRKKGNAKVLIPSCASLEAAQHLVEPMHVFSRVGGYPPGKAPLDPHLRHNIKKFCDRLDVALSNVVGVIP